MKIAYGRVSYGIFSIVAGIIAFFYGHPYISGNTTAVNIIVTVFSVFAGFMIGMLGIIGDTTSLQLRNDWQATEIRRPTVMRRLTRNFYIFYLYLITLTLIFVSALLRNASCDSEIIERLYLGFAVTSLFLSYRIPIVLAQIQKDRYDSLINQQRQDVGLRN